MSKVKKNIWMYLVIIFPLVIDGIDFLVFDRVNDWLMNVLKTPSFNSVMIMLSMYALFVISVFAIGLLDTGKNLHVEKKSKYTVFKNRKKNIIEREVTLFQIILLYLSVGFGIIMLILTANVAGIGSSSKEVLFSDTQKNIILWTVIILLFIHIFVAYSPMKPRFKVNQPGYFFTLVPIVIIGAVVINLSVAAWIHLLTPDKAVIANRNGKILELIVLMPIFLLLFASPRFLFMSREFTKWSLISALLMIAYFIWSSLSYITLY